MTKAAVINLLTEFFPVLVFFIAGQFYSFFVATALLIVLTILSLIVSWLHDRSIAFFPLFSAVFVVISGIVTLYLKEPDALIFADSVYYFFVAGLIVGGLLQQKLFLKWLFSRTFAMYDEGWRILSLRWMYAFVLAGIGNEFVRIFFTPEVWVDYKFVKVILIAIFGFYQFTLSKRYRIIEESNKWGLRTIYTTQLHPHTKD